MAGLLDFLNSDESRLGLGLLAAAGPSATPMSAGQRIQSAMSGVDAYKRDQMRSQLVQSQLDENNAQTAMRRAALEAQMRKQAALPSLYGQSMSPGAFTPSAGGMGPTMPQDAAPQGGQLDWRAALAAGYTPDEITKLSGLPNIGRAKVARTVKGIGPDGKEYEYQVDEFGQKVGDGMAQYRAPISVNQGNRTTFADPYTLKPVSEFQTFQTQDSAASLAEARRHNGVTESNAAATLAAGKTPAGYRPSATGGLEYIPGGPADPAVAKRAAPTEFQGKSTTFAARMQDASKVLDALESDISPANVARAGYKPEFPSWLPGGQIVSAGISTANKLTTPESAQLYRQAQENWVTANLRQESGAAIGKDEMAKDIAKWFPQPGEPEALKLQKAAARKVAERAMLVQSGPGATAIPGIVDGEPSPAPSGAQPTMRWNPKTGKVEMVGR